MELHGHDSYIYRVLPLDGQQALRCHVEVEALPPREHDTVALQGGAWVAATKKTAENGRAVDVGKPLMGINGWLIVIQ